MYATGCDEGVGGRAPRAPEPGFESLQGADDKPVGGGRADDHFGITLVNPTV